MRGRGRRGAALRERETPKSRAHRASPTHSAWMETKRSACTRRRLGDAIRERDEVVAVRAPAPRACRPPGRCGPFSRLAIARVTSFSCVPPRAARARVLAAVAGVDRDDHRGDRPSGPSARASGRRDRASAPAGPEPRPSRARVPARANGAFCGSVGCRDRRRGLQRRRGHLADRIGLLQQRQQRVLRLLGIDVDHEAMLVLAHGRHGKHVGLSPRS